MCAYLLCVCVYQVFPRVDSHTDSIWPLVFLLLLAIFLFFSPTDSRRYSLDICASTQPTTYDYLRPRNLCWWGKIQTDTLLLGGGCHKIHKKNWLTFCFFFSGLLARKDAGRPFIFLENKIELVRYDFVFPSFPMDNLLPMAVIYDH